MRSLLVFFMVLSAITSIAQAEMESSSVKWGGFVDVYFAHDFNRPGQQDRTYTTQPLRHSEFNINLAHVEAVYSKDRVHGRLALQAGTSVLSNYSGEPNATQAGLQRHIQEAYAGYNLTDETSLDAGIYFSHIGLESFISRENWAYTRSLVSDYSPYYQAGVRLTHKFSSVLSGQFHVINGWQNISETNSDKALGLQLAFTPDSVWSITYNNFYGYTPGLRHFHDLVIKWNLFEKTQLAFVGDYGQHRQPDNSFKDWHGLALLLKQDITEKISLVIRAERFNDPSLIVVSAATGFAPTTNGFQVDGASIGINQQLDTNLVWRNEVRGLWSKDPIYPEQSGASQRTVFVVSSLGMTL